jgi:regulator of sigma E protease
VTTIVAFVAVIGILILVHELGHFLVARLAGVGVERFSIGFGPVLWRFRGPETEYCLSAVPLGGYVKMMGDDENPLEGGGKGAVDPARAFHLKPLWVRFLIVFAGPGMNWIAAAFIFSLIYVTVGRPVAPSTLGQITPGGPAAQAGLGTGDRVVAVDGQSVRYWDEMLAAVRASGGETLQVTVETGAGRRQVALTPGRAKERDLFGDERIVWDVGARPFAPATIGEVVPGFPGAEAGLRTGDTVLSLDGSPVLSWEGLAEAIHKRAGRATRLEVRRGSETMVVSVVPRAVKVRAADGREVEEGRIGVGPSLEVSFARSDALTALGQGMARTAEVTALTVLALWKIIVGQIERSNIGGPIQIATAAGEQARQGLPNLAFFTAVISINLALMNVLPIPMLDGGHLLFFACEAILRRPLSVRTREVAQRVGFFVIALLIGFAMYNDLVRIDVMRFIR